MRKSFLWGLTLLSLVSEAAPQVLRLPDHRYRDLRMSTAANNAQYAVQKFYKKVTRPKYKGPKTAAVLALRLIGPESTLEIGLARMLSGSLGQDHENVPSEWTVPALIRQGDVTDEMTFAVHCDTYYIYYGRYNHARFSDCHVRD